MAKFKKKPQEPEIVEAVQWTGDNKAEIEALGFDIDASPISKTLSIKNLKTSHTLREGHWLIKHPSGKTEVHGPIAFNSSYDPIE